MEENNLFNILDAQVKDSSAHEEIIKVAKLAYRCLSLSGSRRPRMIEIAMELEQIRFLQNNSNGQQNHEETSCVSTPHPCQASVLFAISSMVLMDHTDQNLEAVPQSTITPNWTINVSDILRQYFIGRSSLQVLINWPPSSALMLPTEVQRETENTQLAFVTFKDSQGADTASLLTETKLAETDSTVKKAEDMVSTMLAKGFVLGKDAINKAKVFDEQHQLTSNASATVASIDRKMGLSEKLSIGTAEVNDKLKEMDERFQVSEKTKSAFAVAEQKATEDVSVMTKEKVEKAEEEKQENLYRERTAIIKDFAHIHLDESSSTEPAIVPVDSADTKIVMH
ncbi:hypothetical protein SLEP1_g41725 [Rubroshorea leprosula]|uniref:Uncharacterized protein n=1 Tax=Rubroshorea leprosula TaxID=152421 RepID=A0AAV5L8C0_9ROSI|nr:hypothetical protein SLEP1_g41725 [Rubroshorea leprosula]